MGDIPNIDNFNSATLDPKGAYLAIANFYSKQSVALGKDGAGNPANVYENFHSGISDEDFQTMVSEFAQRYNLDIIVEGKDSAVITGSPEVYGLMKQECGDRFSYQLGGAAMVDAFVEHMKTEQINASVMEELYDEELGDSPHLDA